MKFFGKKLGERIINSSLAFVLAVSSVTAVGPFVFSQTASAATDDSGLFTVDTICSNEKAELNLKLKQKGLLTGSILYETPYGNNGNQTLDFGDTDVWLGVKTNLVSAPSVSVSAKVGYWILGHFVALKTYKLMTDAKNCDTTKPTITLADGIEGSYNPTSYSVTANDAGGLDVVTAHLRGPNDYFKSCTTYGVKATNYTLSCVVPVDLPDGTYNIRYNAKDLAGNLSDTTTAYFTIDHTFPTFTLTDDGNPKAPILNGSIVNPTKLGDKDNNGDTIRFTKESASDVLYVNGTKINAGGYVGQLSGQIGWRFSSDGVYTVYTKDAAGNQSTPITFTVDTTPPAAPQLVSPSNGAVVKGANLVNDWADVDDADYYVYQSFNVNGDGTCNLNSKRFSGIGYVFTDSETNSRDVSDLAYCWRVKAVDAAGNESAWSELWKTIVDNTAPVVVITSPTVSLVNGNVEVRATVTDQNLRHYWYEIKKNGAKITSQTVLSSGISNKLLATLTDEGVYTITVAARDKAGGTADSGNRSADVVTVVTIDKTAKVVGNYFVAMSNELNVGFTVSNLNNNAEKVEVALYDADGNLITKNVGDSQQMIDLLNSNPDEISSPFWIPSQGDTDGWWTFGNPDWKNVSKPSYAVVTVYYGGSETAKSDKISFISPSEGGFTWEELIAQLPADSSEESDPAGSDDQNSESSGQGTTGTPNDGNQGQNNGGNVGGTTGTDGQTSDEGETSEDEDVAGASTEGNGEGEESGEDILGTSTSDKDGTWNILGLAWYWWLLILAAVAAILRALYRRFATQEN